MFLSLSLSLSFCVRRRLHSLFTIRESQEFSLERDTQWIQEKAAGGGGGGGLGRRRKRVDAERDGGVTTTGREGGKRAALSELSRHFVFRDHGRGGGEGRPVSQGREGKKKESTSRGHKCIYEEKDFHKNRESKSSRQALLSSLLEHQKFCNSSVFMSCDVPQQEQKEKPLSLSSRLDTWVLGSICPLSLTRGITNHESQSVSKGWGSEGGKE